jgi:hypothetical protein
MRTMKWAIAIVLFALAMWILLDQVSWHIRFRPANYLTSLGAASTALTAILSAIAAAGVLVYVVLTYRLWRETQRSAEDARRTTEATLMSQLMAEYDSMRDSVTKVQDFYRRFDSADEAVETFHKARASRDLDSDVIREVDPARFRVSRFFVRIRKLARAGFLSRRIVWLALQRAAIEDVFLGQVDPLDQVISELTYGRRNVVDRDFFRQLLQEQSDTSDHSARTPSPRLTGGCMSENP